MPQLLKNNVSGVLSQLLSDSGSSMTLLDASEFPSPGSDYYLATLVGVDANAREDKWEIVKVTAKASNTLTITRAQENTTARSWPAGTQVQMRLTAASVATPDALSAAVVAHEAASDPHPQYATAAEAAAAAPVQSVAGKTGAVTLTKADVGLGNVDNTSDASKPVSTAQQAALDAKINATGGTASGLTLNDGYTEEVFAVTGTTPALSPTNGSIQTWTLSGNSTPTAGIWAAGQSITLMVDDGSAATITWTSLAVTWKTDGGSAPTLNTTGYTAIALWKVGSVIYGARVGDA